MKSFFHHGALVLVLFTGTWLSSCKKILNVQPQGVVDAADMYRDLNDANAAVIGIYGKFMNLAEPYVLLNGLRGDLMTTTSNSDAWLKQLNEHEVTADNPYIDPRPFYEVILNCNDALYNLDKMLAEKRIKQAPYNAIYSDLASLRCWVYLELGIQYGNVPYVTDPLASESAMENIKLMPRVSFTELLDRLIQTMESLPSLDPYPSGNSLITSIDGYSTAKFFINKEMLLGKLYLWKGMYHKAAMAFKDVMETGATGDLYTYRITGSSKGDNNDLAVGYIRYQELNESSLIDNNSQGWRSIFARNEDALFNDEWIWYLPFDNTFNSNDPFINLFSNRGGSYLVKPSQAAIDNWNSQLQKNNFPYDARGKFSWRSLDGQPVIMKYLYNYLDPTGFYPIGEFTKKGKWFLERAASLHLYYAEAANRDGQHALAYALVNQGLTTLPGKQTNEGFPYDFDARKSNIPPVLGNWCLNAGIRGRADLYSDTLAATEDSTTAIENMIINEAALELAYEGRRWPDLLRISLRRNDPAFLADKVYAMLQKENDPQAATVKAKLLNEQNWYLPFDMK
jgi:hypothetical protein